MNNYKMCKNAFFNGENNYKNCYYEIAKFWYKISKQHPRYINESIHKLFLIELKVGRFDKARDLLNFNYYFDSPIIERCFGQLESIEYNFEKAIENYKSCLEDEENNSYLNMEIAKCYYELGMHNEAWSFLEKIENKDNPSIMLFKICILYYERKYEHALKLLNLIDISKLKPMDFRTYKDILILLNYKIGNITSINNLTRYLYARLFDKDDKLLSEHIKKHFETTQTDFGNLKKELDTFELIELCKKTIKNMNGNHYGISDIYRCRLDNIIGTKRNEPTKDIEIVTYLDSKDIITMYPIMLSSEFDTEKMTTDKELKLRREKNQK